MSIHGELPFVGVKRREIVDWLVSVFDEVVARPQPRWISLEAGTGWGKTRVLHEFFRRLAHRQQTPRYWPPSILDAVRDEELEALTSPEARRKRVFPSWFSPEPGAIPEWFWWGISCSARAGTPTQALADDLTQFAAHRAALEQRWAKQAPAATWVHRVFRSDKGRELAESATGEAVGAAAAALTNVTVPGLGLAVLLAKWGIQSAKGRNWKEASDQIDAADIGRSDLVDNLAPSLVQLARGGVPLIIAVEDLHLADASLVDLMTRLLAAHETPVFIVSTAWPGLIDEEHRPACTLLKQVKPAVMERCTPGSRLGPLEPDSLAELVKYLLPAADGPTTEALVERFPNPLALELVCSMRRVRREVKSSGQLSSTLLSGLPPSVRGLYALAWSELPQELRHLLMVAALSQPDTINREFGFSDQRWDSDVLINSIRAVRYLDETVGELAIELDSAEDAYAWIRSLDTWLRRFNEPAQRDIALENARNELTDDELRDLYGAAASLIQLENKEGDDRWRHHARTLVTLAAEGFVPWEERNLRAVVMLAEEMLSSPHIRDLRFAAHLAATAVDGSNASLSQHPLSLRLRALRADALGRAGYVGEAIDMLLALSEDQVRALGPDHPDLLRTRGQLALRTGEAGRVSEAIDMLLALSEDQVRALGPDHPDSLRTRGQLALLMDKANRVAEALKMLRALLQDQERLLGPDHPDSLRTRGYLARSLDRCVQIREAFYSFASLLRDQVRVLGPEHLETLTTLAHLYASGFGAARGAPALRALLERLHEVPPEDHPEILKIRGLVARLLRQKHDDRNALKEFGRLQRDLERLLGLEHPDTLENWYQTAITYPPRVAIRQLQALLIHRQHVLGDEHINTLRTRSMIAHLRQPPPDKDAWNEFWASFDD